MNIQFINLKILNNIKYVNQIIGSIPKIGINCELINAGWSAFKCLSGKPNNDGKK